MPAPLDPLSLRLFIATCEERNIARAAAREALVASALSKRIGALEQQLGVVLLERGRRGIEPTAAGEALLRQAREILAAMDRAQAEMADFAHGVRGSVRVAASVSALAEHLPDDIASFLAEHPAVRVSADERISGDVLRAVRSGAADLGVVWDAADTAGLAVAPYHADHLVVVVPQAHPLVARARLRFADTLPYPAVGLAPSGLMDQLLRREAARLGQTLDYRMQVSSLDAGVRVAAAGLGLAIAPLEMVAAVTGGLPVVCRPLAEPWATRRFVLAWRGDEHLANAARALLAHLRAAAGPAT